MKKLMGDQDNIRENLFSYIQEFSPAVRDIFECFDFYARIDRMAKAGLLYLITEKFSNIDLHPEVVSNAQMGTGFEELIRKFAELSNETAGEHMSPREVIRLMVNLLFIEDDEILSRPGVVRSLSNPPFGVEWKKIEAFIRKEYEEQGFNGRFGPGLPRVSDGSLLFLLHLISRMRPVKDGGSRIGIVLNGSPLFTGGAGSGESEIRRYVLENDLLEAIIGLPTDMFYNTGISTYIWILSNRKPANRKGKLQLIDASGMWQKMRKSLGSKRKELSPEHIEEITRIFGECKEVYVDPDTNKPISKKALASGVPAVPISRIFKNEDFGYHTITVERPLRDESGNTVKGTKGKLKGKVQPDANLRDTENVSLSEDIEAYFKREVLPHAPDAWIDEEKTKVGYEIPFNRHFYVFKPPRDLAAIDADLKVVTDRILTMIGGLSK